MAEIGVPFFSEYCEKCAIALDLPEHVSRCDLCGSRPVWKWVIYRRGFYAGGCKLDLCKPEEISQANKVG